jgi:hypothetical protein
VRNVTKPKQRRKVAVLNPLNRLMVLCVVIVANGMRIGRKRWNVASDNLVDKQGDIIYNIFIQRGVQSDHKNYHFNCIGIGVGALSPIYQQKNCKGGDVAVYSNGDRKKIRGH